MRTNFTIQLPKRIIFGEGSVREVPELVKQFGAGSLVVVSDPVISRMGLVDQVVKPLHELGVKTEVFDRVEPEPSLHAAEQVVAVARKSSYDLVIGLGGGSSLDMAKLASISATNPEPVTDFIGVGKVQRPGIPKILIPTTAGTGAEITMNSIISNREEHLKLGIVTPFNIADVALIDPLLTHTLPPKVTASTGLDALTHAVESLMSVDLNPFCKPLALDAVGLIFRSLPTAYREGRDGAARRDMSLASMLAGMSLAISGVLAGHAAAYSYSVTVPHGTGCAIALPYVMEYNAPSCLPMLVAVAEAAGVMEPGESREKNAFNAVQAVRRLMEEVGSPTSLKQIGIPESDIESMAKRMLTVKRLLAHNPRVFTVEDAVQLFKRMYEGTPLPLAEYRLRIERGVHTGESASAHK
ncbi:MAG: iron-containing alcohol dehydrogenase [Candidatus Bathyarchaeia archaeon]